MRRWLICLVLCFAMTATVAGARVLPGASFRALASAPTSSGSDPAAAHVARAAASRHTSMRFLFGRRRIVPSAGPHVAGRAMAFRFQEAARGSAGAITVYVTASSTSKTLLAGLYTDRGGKPGSLLASGARSVSSGRWVTVTIKRTPLAKGRVYWIAVLGKGGTLATGGRRSAACQSVTESHAALSALPRAWSQGGSLNDCISAYVSGWLLTKGTRAGANAGGSSPTGAAPTDGTTAGPTPAGVSAQPTSPPVGGASSLPPASTTLPSIAGTALVGSALTASTGSWNGTPTSYAYQWQDCASVLCVNIQAATGSAYVLQPSDVGHTLDVVVTAINAGGSASATSAQTAAITSATPAAPANTAVPTITGAAQQGQTLTASDGSWSGSPTSYAYHWQDCTSSTSCTNVTGATTSTYTLQSSDVGKTIDIVVTATNAGGSTPATSAQTQAVTASAPTAPQNTGLPTITGTAQQGQTLTASNGSWSGSPTSYTYQWQDCTSSTSCTNITGATNSTYTLQSSDVGDTIDIVVTATNASGPSSATSNQSASVTSSPTPPANTALPAVSGQTVEGQTLTTGNGSWSSSPTGYTYAWEDCDTSGANCTTISNATASTYTLTGTDVGDTIRSVVTAANAGGSNSATSSQTAVVTSSGASDPQLSCNLNATTSNFTTQLADATPGQVVCLASGDYSSFTGTSKSSPGITITSAPNAMVTFNSGMNVNLSSAQNFTLDGTGGGGTMTIGGELDLSTSGSSLQNKALNLTFQNIAFTASSNAVLIEGPENSNIVFNRDTFVDGNAACSGGSPSTLGAAFMLLYKTATATTPSGVTLENSVFVAPGDLWNPNRAMESESGLTIENNVIAGFLDHTESASCNHIDGLQIYSGSNSPWGGITFTGNLCYDDYDCIAGFDGTSDNTITDNACFDIEQNCIDLYSDTGSVINHNTQEAGGADPSGCATEPSTQACSSSTLFLNSNKTGDSSPSGETYTNNLDQHGPNAESGSLSTNTNNMWSSASSPNIRGTATFTGGSDPMTWAGFELTSGSTGHAGGSDGLDVGIRSSEGGPPTGGGSAPVNTVAPSLSGTATEGDTLTTTNGTWTITGSVPTATTYMWYDCPTSTFSAASCRPIQPQTAPTSANSTTYTLQASDAGDYVLSEVTVTNGNGQVNATSNAIGPIAS